MDPGPFHNVVTPPDFRNLGVLLRTLVLAEAANLIALISHSPDMGSALKRLGGAGVPFESSLLVVVLVLFILAPKLNRLRYHQSVGSILAIVAAVSGGCELAFSMWVGAMPGTAPIKAATLGGLLAALILCYFNWRQRVLSPALVTARLMALQSRIRPHFLFNSLNTAVSLVRQDARLAEQVLLDMSDLFRVLLADSRALVPLADEIRLAKAYLAIEQLRLGERLRVRWLAEDAPLAAEVPILVLQPLLENAVRYGVEPCADGGEVTVSIGNSGGKLVIEVRNAMYEAGTPVPAGNRIALANIEERIALHFDAEGSLRTSVKGGEFVVWMSMPLSGVRA